MDSSAPTRRLSKRKSTRNSPTVIYVNAPTDSPPTSPQSSVSMQQQHQNPFEVPPMSYAGLTPGSATAMSSSSRLVRGNSQERPSHTATPGYSTESEKVQPPMRHLSPSPGIDVTAQRIARGSMGGGFGPYAYHLRAGQPRSSATFSMTTGTSSPQYFRPALAHPTTFTTPLQPAAWVTDEIDGEDPLHDPRSRPHWTPFSARGCLNVFTLLLLVAALLGLFLGYPLTSVLVNGDIRQLGGTKPPLGVNGTGQVPSLNMPSVIDIDTPDEAKTRLGSDGFTYELVFSDEFNVDGRTFWPGDDPYWEAVDLHYWPTGNLEWESPEAIITQDGSLVITISEQQVNGFDWQSGMMTTWNKWCFTTGYVEVNVSLPGAHNAPGFWPAVWTMGNLGRAGYGATTDGTWPYSYDACDVGSVPNQMWQNNTPASSLTDNGFGGQLSTTAGQRFSACTCPGEDHPGPSNNIGRGVPEIDVFEAQIEPTTMTGEVSQSFQTAPFSANYSWTNTTLASGPSLVDSDISIWNSYKGGSLQQALSAVTEIADDVYNATQYAVYGYEWWSDPSKRSDGYVKWYSQGEESWTLPAAAIGPDPISGVSQRLIPEEPMYLIMNLGMAPSFEHQDFKHLVFPSSMYVDYIRVYQRQGSVNVGCNPASHPTTDYINRNIVAYANPNLTDWALTNNSWPRNSLYDGCS